MSEAGLCWYVRHYLIVPMKIVAQVVNSVLQLFITAVPMQVFWKLQSRLQNLVLSAIPTTKHGMSLLTVPSAFSFTRTIQCCGRELSCAVTQHPFVISAPMVKITHCIQVISPLDV